MKFSLFNVFMSLIVCVVNSVPTDYQKTRHDEHEDINIDIKVYDSNSNFNFPQQEYQKWIENCEYLTRQLIIINIKSFFSFFIRHSYLDQLSKLFDTHFGSSLQEKFNELVN